MAGYKLVFTMIHKVDGSIRTFIARLVAKELTQTNDVDNHEIFAPLAKVNVVRIHLSCTANLDLDLQQFDVKNELLQDTTANLFNL